MLKLLRGGFYRNFHSTAFRVCLIFSVLLGGIFGYRLSSGVELNEIAFIFEIIIFGVLVSLIIGTETEKNIKNKLTVGHRATSVFFSELLVAIGSLLIFDLIFLFFSFCFSISILGHIPLKLILQCVAGFGCLTVFLASLLLLLSALVSKKAVAIILCLVAIIALYVSAEFTTSTLKEKEFFQKMQIDPQTSKQKYLLEENPAYVKEPMRSFLQAYANLNPFCLRKQYEDILFPFLFDDEKWELAKEATANTIGNEHLMREVTPLENRFLNLTPLYLLSMSLPILLAGWTIFRKKQFR